MAIRAVFARTLVLFPVFTYTVFASFIPQFRVMLVGAIGTRATANLPAEAGELTPIRSVLVLTFGSQLTLALQLRDALRSVSEPFVQHFVVVRPMSPSIALGAGAIRFAIREFLEPGLYHHIVGTFVRSMLVTGALTAFAAS